MNAQPGRDSAVKVSFDPLVYSPVPATNPPFASPEATVTLFVATVSSFFGLYGVTDALIVLSFWSTIVTVQTVASPSVSPFGVASCSVKNSSPSTVLSVLTGMVITFSPISPFAQLSVSGNFSPPFGVTPSSAAFARSRSAAAAV